MGIKSLRKIQIGAEGTPGTAVAATTLWRGMGALTDEEELQFIEEDIGVLSQPDSAYIAKLQAGLKMEEVDASFEQLPYILAAGVKNVTSGVRDGAGKDPYIYEYPMPMATANVVKTYTIEGGDEAGAERVEYCFVEEFTISGAAGEAVKCSAQWTGRQAVPFTYTPSIAVPANEILLFNKGRFYIDDVLTGNFGGSRKTDTLLSFELKVTTGWIPKWTLDDALYFRFIRATRPEVKLTLTMEHNDVALGEKVAARTTGGKGRLFRLIFEGSNFTIPGTIYSKKTLIIDCVGKYVTIPSLDDEDGDNILEFEATGQWTQAAEVGPPARDGYLKFTVVNGLSTLP